MTRIALYKLARKGQRGFSLTVHPDWIRQHGLTVGSRIDVYVNDRGELVYRPVKE